ncbi:MAG: hypothetical protein M3138_01335 [Actinomycetota bacterium]|nr:hypothetical protein [Actinomycetota bacterium]
MLPDARLDPVEQLELDRDPQVLRLDNGERYVFELRPYGEGTFSFLTVVP